MKIFLSLLLVALPIIGIADSSIITYDKFAGIIPECGVGFDCGAVLTSKWASVGPIPLSLLGFFFYCSVFIVSILNFIEFDFSLITNKILTPLKFKEKSILYSITTIDLLVLLTTFGFFFSLYLVFLMGVVIGAWCKYCLISAATSSLLFAVSTLLYYTSEKNSSFFIKQIVFGCISFLYTRIAKPIFFLFDAEFVHNLMTFFGNMLGKLEVTKIATQLLFGFTHENNKKVLDGIVFPNPVGLAAGFDYNGQLTEILPSVGFGFHTIGTVTYHPYEGNTKPRLGRFPNSNSLLVNKGFKSLGVHEVVRRLENKKFTIPVGISIGSTNKHYENEKEQILDILKTFKIFEQSKVKHSYYELNISCPNTFGGEPFTTPSRLLLLLTALKSLSIKKPIYVKMPIDQSKADTLKLLAILNQFSVNGVIFGNLTKDKNNPDVTKEDRVEWMHRKGNLSGKPTWNRSNQLIELTRKTYKKRFTIIGTGGVFSGKDAKIKIGLGADLIQLITGMIFQGPQVIGQINATLAQKK